MPDAVPARPVLRPRARDAQEAALTRLRRLLAGAGGRPEPAEPVLHDDARDEVHDDEVHDEACGAAHVARADPAAGRSWPASVSGAGRARWHVEPAAAVAVVLVAVAALVGGGVYVWQSRPAPVAPPQPAPVSTSPAAAEPGPTPTPSPTSVVVVDVTGKVRRPGVVTLPEGSRVVDALEAAGGARRRADTTSLNLARVLADGEQVRVDVPGAPPAPAGGGSSAAPALVDLNTADLAGLEELPGVGPVLAQRIIDHRESIGGFTAVDELQEVSGIGDQRLADLRDLVRV
jgi:competence protein ComEA